MENISSSNDLNFEILSFIEKQLDFEGLLYKKYLTYGNLLYDSELKNICYTSSQKHKENYERLLAYLGQ